MRSGAFLLTIAMIWSWAAGALPAQPTPMPAPASQLEDQVRALFEISCAECHDVARRPQPKGDFGHVLDLARLAADPDYIRPGQPERSELYRYLIEPDPELVMPPPTSKVHQPSQAEIQLVADWITALGAAPPVAAKSNPPTPKTPPDALTVFARTHVMWVHFPVALLILAALVDWLALPLRRVATWLPVTRWCLGVAAVSSIFSAIAGWFLASAEGFAPDTVFLHRWLGVVTAGAAAVSWGLLEAAERAGKPRLRWLARAATTAAAFLVALAGHTGGELVYGAGFPFQ